MTDKLRRVAVIGGSRIPFCRSNTIYAEKTNLDMLAAAIQGVADRFGLDGEQMDEVVAGAVTTHSKDWNLAREAVLSTTLSPLTPGITIQQACGTSLQAALGIAAKISSGQIECGIAAGTDTTSDAPIVFSRRFSRRLVKLGRARSMSERLKVLKGLSPAELKPVPPANGEPRTHLSMGQHCERMAREWNISREAQDELAVQSHHAAARAWDEGFFDPLVQTWGGVARDNNLRPDTDSEQMAKLRTVFGRDESATLTAGNSTPLTDGAAGVLLASEEWAAQRGLPVQAYLTAGRHSAVDFVNDEGLLMAPTVAVSELLDRSGHNLQDFDFYELHEAFAAQVLCTLAAWESDDYCRNRLGREKAMGAIDRSKLNVKGSSLAVGHPFAATGARILGTLSEILSKQDGPARGLISVCTAGGMGVAAIVESTDYAV
ncbi:MAG: acetyl-CoA C-acetyltransferase [Gammaproteobacteria bacterium]|nr:acetyl-CoA C-acetyltransferase [Gammaproteobacteria bacterium]NNE06458.1 acetyl-CoA C-acetyltransferase [Xanthomonadales bacterium]